MDHVREPPGTTSGGPSRDHGGGAGGGGLQPEHLLPWRFHMF